LEKTTNYHLKIDKWNYKEMSCKPTQGTNQGDEEGKGEGATNKWAYLNNDLERKPL